MSALVVPEIFNITKSKLGDSNKTDWKGLQQYLSDLRDPSSCEYALREVGNIFNVPVINKRKADDDYMPPYLPKMKDAIAVKYIDDDSNMWRFHGIMDEKERRAVRQCALMSEEKKLELRALYQELEGFPEAERASILKRWTGSGWVQVADLEHYTGSAWESVTAGRYWTGSAWETFWSRIPAGLGFVRQATTSQSGWTRYAAGDNRYLIVTNGSVGAHPSGSDTHGHNNVSYLVGGVDSAQRQQLQEKGVLFRRGGYGFHTHTVAASHSCGSNNAYPARGNFYLYTADDDGQHEIPSTSSVFWTGTTGNIPAGWAQTAGWANYYLRGVSGSPGAVAGSFQNHITDTGTLTNNETSGEVEGFNEQAQLMGDWGMFHTHTMSSHTHPSTLYSAAYLGVIMMHSTENQFIIPVGAATWFTQVPSPISGVTWVDLGASYNDRILLMGNSWGNTGGSTTHTHAHNQTPDVSSIHTENKSIASTNVTNNLDAGGFWMHSANHRHTITSTPAHNSQSNFPAASKILLYQRSE